MSVSEELNKLGSQEASVIPLKQNLNIKHIVSIESSYLGQLQIVTSVRKDKSINTSADTFSVDRNFHKLFRIRIHIE